jgi:hypothetical protein
MRVLAIIGLVVALIGCSQSSKIPSLKGGKNTFVSCFFQPTSVYKDVVFDVRFDKKSNSSELIFLKPPQDFKSTVLTYTDSRLALELTSNKDEKFIINFNFDNSTFDIKSKTYNDTGFCEEKVK